MELGDLQWVRHNGNILLMAYLPSWVINDFNPMIQLVGLTMNIFVMLYKIDK